MIDLGTFCLGRKSAATAIMLSVRRESIFNDVETLTIDRQCLGHPGGMHRSASTPECSITSHRGSLAHAIPRKSRGLRVAGAGCFDLRKLAARGPKFQRQRQQGNQACDLKKSPAQGFPRNDARHKKSKRGQPLKAAKTGTFSEDPWQEDSGRHEVLESMEEVGKHHAIARASGTVHHTCIVRTSLLNPTRLL